MRKIIVAVVISAALVSAATAKPGTTTYFRSGGWSNYAGRTSDDNLICGMSTFNSRMSLHIKYSDNSLYIAAFKDTWRIPKGTTMSVDVGFDKTASWSDVKATGSMNTNGWGVITINVANSFMSGFLEEVAGADKMWIKFNSGNETPWVADMTGSRKSVEAFKVCLDRFFGGGATQPFGTQPYGKSSPTQPFDKTAPGPKPGTPGLKPYESRI
jgi:hypothetical protein